jgi:hypothetical protein
MHGEAYDGFKLKEYVNRSVTPAKAGVQEHKKRRYVINRLLERPRLIYNLKSIDAFNSLSLNGEGMDEGA